MHIFDIIKQNYDMEEEFLKIKSLFLKKIFHPVGLYSSLAIEDIADLYFSKYDNRNNIENCQEFKNKINNYINKKDNSYYPLFKNIENIIIYLEYFINIISFVESLDVIKNIKYDENKYKILKDNINLLIENTNYEKFIDKKTKQILLIPKNPEAIAVAEQTKNIEIANAILKYNHYSLKGNLEDKRNLLISIANEYNDFLHSKLAGFNKELDMAIFLINNCHIRHNNKSGNEEKKLIANLKNEDLEKLYDDTYQLILFCILAKTNVERMKNFEEKVKKPIINGGKKCNTQ